MRIHPSVSVVSDDLAEVHAFLKAYPETIGLEVIVPDTNGVLRGKRLPRDKIEDFYRTGIRMPGSVFAVSVTGEEITESGLQWEEGDRDVVGRPIPGTLAPVSWYDRPFAQALTHFYESDGRPYFADPRQVLKSVVDRYSAQGLAPALAVELEFYLTDKQLTENGRPQPPISPATGFRQENFQVYGLAPVYEFEGFFAEVERAATAQGLPLEAIIAEGSPGQYEVNLTYVTDALQAADHGVLLRRLIKGVAQECGFLASFMAKPFFGRAGSGLHLHFSLRDENGRNLFDDGGPLGSVQLRHAIGGLLHYMPDSMAIFAPNANSYRRVQKGSFAPTGIAWGYNNRTTAIRIPEQGGPARRLEHRVAGADANIYLASAAILAAAHRGMIHKMEPAPALEGNAYAKAKAHLPNNWQAALHRFDASDLFKDYFGEAFCKLYSTCRWVECDQFSAAISDIDYQWYLDAL